jgi:hypothetical protein
LKENKYAFSKRETNNKNHGSNFKKRKCRSD